MKEEKCGDCPNIIERREADAMFRAKMTANFDNLTASLDKIEMAVWDAVGETRKDIKNLYFRIGLIAGGSGAVGGVIAALVAEAIQR